MFFRRCCYFLFFFSELAAPASSFSARVGGQKVVVVERNLSWPDALLYCRDFYWDLLSIHSEEEQMEVEGALNSTSFPLTKHVWLGLRRTLMAGTWFWMPGESLSYAHWKTGHAWQITSPCGGMETETPTYWRDLPCGDHLYFICLTDVLTRDSRVPFYTSVRGEPPKGKA
ncbi:C-type lectin-like [Embiotoca jacksoni]|uniref:C-type lectin-like n=1 Tax=Embiotoca jacksoni TaxID=100190 RepID=UPI003703D503